jgi:hypothetical protein
VPVKKKSSERKIFALFATLSPSIYNEGEKKCPASRANAANGTAKVGSG